MKHRLSSRLSPRAKKMALTGGEEVPVRALIQVAPAADPDELRGALAAVGAEAGSWSSETRLLVAEIPAGALARVAELPGVVYVEAESPYRT